MVNKFLPEGERKMYEYIANKYFKIIHIYIEVNVDKYIPRRTSIETIKIFMNERKCIKFGRSREDYIRKYNDDSDFNSIYQYYESIQFEN